MARHKKHHGVRLRSLFLWHRYFGLASALFVMTLAVSGILINYSDDLRLNKRPVRADWLLDWYGIAAPAIAGGYATSAHWITQVGERIYFDGQEINEAVPPLYGALQVADTLVIAAGNQLLLLTPQGEMIDRLSGLAGLPDSVRAVDTDRGHVVVRTPRGNYQGDDQFLTWRPIDAKGVEWARTAPLPPSLRDTLVKRYRGAGVSWERLLLDLHSGRLFGRAGVAVMNIAALLMVLLAISGAWHFFKRKRR